jgi:hypothetical protein
VKLKNNEKIKGIFRRKPIILNQLVLNLILQHLKLYKNTGTKIKQRCLLRLAINQICIFKYTFWKYILAEPVVCWNYFHLICLYNRGFH